MKCECELARTSFVNVNFVVVVVDLLYVPLLMVFVYIIVITPLLILTRKSICYGRLEHRNLNT